MHAALMETIHIASLGTLLALILALPVGVLAAHNLVPFTPLNLFAKLILVSSRSVNSLVWALLFVGIFGPGALAGTLAIAFRSIGFVGKLFGEALEEAQPGPIEALTAAGAPWMSRMTFGYWPQVTPAFWSIALFRWDINVRESAVLGLVGAGGIGMALDSALNLFQWDRVALILLAILAVVVIAEVVVTQVRKRSSEHWRILRAMATIAVFNQKGGVGKTTTALNLLAAIAQHKARPLGIDLDPQGHLSHIFGVQPRQADRHDLQLLHAAAAADRHRAVHQAAA